MNKLILLTGSLLLGINAMAQTNAPDTAFQAVAVNSAKQIAVTSNARQSGLYNGPAYHEPIQSHFEQFPFYRSNDWIEGVVFYDGVRYENVSLQYDILNDLLVTEVRQSAAKIQLIKGKVHYFILDGLLFQNLTSGPGRGFYACLYSGTTKVYARYEKRRQERIENRNVDIDFEEKKKYYILKNDKYFEVKSQGDVLKVLGDRKAEVKQFIKKNISKFSANKESSLSSIAEFYDTISTQ